MKAIRRKWNKLSLFQQILWAFLLFVLVFIFGPLLMPILLPLAAFLLLAVVPIMVAWCILKLAIGKEGK